MSNFAFLPTEFRAIAEAATKAEGHIMGVRQVNLHQSPAPDAEL